MDYNSPPPKPDPNDTFEPGRTPPFPSEPVGDAGEWQRIKQQAVELADYFSYYLEARTDILKLRLRQFLFRLLMEVAGILLVAGLLVAAITLIFIGVARGLAQVFANQPWLGPLIAGLVLLGIISLVAWWWWVGTRKAAHNRMVKKYEQRKRHQRDRFGHDVVSRAEAAPTEQRTGISDPTSR